MPAKLRAIGLFVAFAAYSPGVFAQTAPLPGIPTGGLTGLLTRSAFIVSAASMQTDDPRFSLVQRSRADLDLFGYRKGRVNLLVDVELVAGSERRAFDLNHANVIIETSSSYHLGRIDVEGVFHHESRHVVDREFDRLAAWHTVGARAEHRFITRQGTIDASAEYSRVVQHTFVDYTWTSQLTARLDRPLRRATHVFANGRGGFVGVDPLVTHRGVQTGARAEGGVRLVAERGAVDLFAAYERRVDGHPTSRDPSSWFEFGFRLGTP